MTSTTLDAIAPELHDQGARPQREILLSRTPPYHEYLQDRAAAVAVGHAIKIALVLLSLVSTGLVALTLVTVNRYAHLKPLVIRIDELGRAEALSYDAASVYKPREKELRFHLREFMQNYLSRERPTLSRDYPKALPFLKPYMLGRLDPRDTQDVMDTFRNTPNADDIQVRVKNIVLSELVTPPFKAGITFERRMLFPGSDRPRTEPQLVAAQVTFEVLETAPQWVRDANPLAIAVTDVAIAEPFQ